MSVSYILSVIVATAVQMQQPSLLESLLQRGPSECVSVDYEFSSDMSGVKAVGSGNVILQGNSYHMQGNGVEIYCDGTSTWLIDEYAKEVLVESADSEEAGYLANPVLLLMNLEKSASSYKADGNTVTLSLDGGMTLDITLTHLTALDTKKPEAFRPPTQFGSDWVVTDLR